MEIIEKQDLSSYYSQKIIKEGCLNYDNVIKSDKKFAENLKCPICLDLIYNPSTCNNCSCLIGGSCLINWLKGGSNMCPYGCQNFNKKQKNDPTLINLLNRISITCENLPCPENPSVENYYNHLKTCEFRIFKCNGRGCFFEGYQAMIEKHILEDCSHTFSYCINCKKEILFREFTEHELFCKNNRPSSKKNSKDLNHKSSKSPKKLMTEGSEIPSIKNPIISSFDASNRKIVNEKKLKKCVTGGIIALGILIVIFLYYYINPSTIITEIDKRPPIIEKSNIVNNSIYKNNLENVKSLIRIGEEHLENGRYLEAISSFHNVPALDKENNDIYNKIGWCYFKLDKYENAQLFYDKALEKNPRNYMVYNNLGLLHDKLNQLKEAITYYEIAIKINPNFKEVYNNLGFTQLRSEQFLKAVPNLKKAVEMDPEFSEALLNLGTAYAGIRNYKLAIKYYNKIIYEKFDNTLTKRSETSKQLLKEVIEFKPTSSLNINHSKAYLYKGLSLKDSGDVLGCIKSLKKALLIDKTNYMALLHLGISYEFLGNYEDAEENYKNAIKYNKNFREAKERYGIFLNNLRRNEEALKLFQENEKMKPKRKIDIYYIGKIYLEMGRYEESKIFLNKAIEMNPHYRDAYYTLGLLYKKLKNLDLSIKYLKSALDIDPNFDKAIKVLTTIYENYPNKIPKSYLEDESSHHDDL